MVNGVPSVSRDLAFDVTQRAAQGSLQSDHDDAQLHEVEEMNLVLVQPANRSFTYTVMGHFRFRCFYTGIC